MIPTSLPSAVVESPSIVWVYNSTRGSVGSVGTRVEAAQGWLAIPRLPPPRHGAALQCTYLAVAVHKDALHLRIQLGRVPAGLGTDCTSSAAREIVPLLRTSLV